MTEHPVAPVVLRVLRYVAEAGAAAVLVSAVIAAARTQLRVRRVHTNGWRQLS